MCVCVDVQGHTQKNNISQSINQIDYVGSNQETTAARMEVKILTAYKSRVHTHAHCYSWGYCLGCVFDSDLRGMEFLGRLCE